jgi:hypothetical protein
MNIHEPHPAPEGFSWVNLECYGECDNPECDGWFLRCADEECSKDHGLAERLAITPSA